ncbi:MAG TPA: amino acid permease [Tepidisphaeraceae bacterium]|nr:amino acid permease [Tepidisphaeraceae bacterium]
MHATENASGTTKSAALLLLASERPRNVSWKQAAGLLFGDWGTSRLYVLGLALFFAGRTSFWLILLMSLLILAVGWAYTQICRIYPDGGGVYTAAKSKSRTLAVIGALLLFADYTVTASLSGLDAFHYFGLGGEAASVADKDQLAPQAQQVQLATAEYSTQSDVDAGATLYPHRASPPSAKEQLFSLKSPAFWAIVALITIGLFNLMGPKHTGGFAIMAAVGMVFITLLITAFALPQVPWAQLPHRIGSFHHQPADMWVAFVSIVLALSGVEAIANLTGVMEKPVAATARKAIWVVATEVAVFNVLLAIFMLAIFPINRDAHLADMAAYLTGHYVGMWGEWGVRIIGGVLLLSACNTAITDMISVQYLMARDGELPQVMTGLNRFGVPWMPALVATSVPILVLLISHDLDSLAALYAIGVIGAVAINVTLCAMHPRLRKIRRKIPMMALGIVLLAIWVTLAFVKHEALVFVTIVMVVGLSGRTLTKWLATRKGPKLSLLQKAIMDQLTSDDALAKPRILIGTYGSDSIAPAALREAVNTNSTLVVCFIREVQLSYKYDGEQRLTLETDQAAQKTFGRFLDLAHEAGVTILPVYDTGPDAAELMAEHAAMHGCGRVLIGTTRQGALYHLIKGHFQRRLESLLPPDIPVQVVAAAPGK